MTYFGTDTDDVPVHATRRQLTHDSSVNVAVEHTRVRTGTHRYRSVYRHRRTLRVQPTVGLELGKVKGLLTDSACRTSFWGILRTANGGCTLIERHDRRVGCYH